MDSKHISKVAEQVKRYGKTVCYSWDNRLEACRKVVENVHMLQHVPHFVTWKMAEGGQEPTRDTEVSSGFDCYPLTPCELPPHDTTRILLGCSARYDRNLSMTIYGLSANAKLGVLVHPLIYDQNYKGMMYVDVFNSTDDAIVVGGTKPICQAVFSNRVQMIVKTEPWTPEEEMRDRHFMKTMGAKRKLHFSDEVVTPKTLRKEPAATYAQYRLEPSQVPQEPEEDDTKTVVGDDDVEFIGEENADTISEPTQSQEPRQQTSGRANAQLVGRKHLAQARQNLTTLLHKTREKRYGAEPSTSTEVGGTSTERNPVSI